MTTGGVAGVAWGGAVVAGMMAGLGDEATGFGATGARGIMG